MRTDRSIIVCAISGANLGGSRRIWGGEAVNPPKERVIDVTPDADEAQLDPVPTPVQGQLACDHSDAWLAFSGP
jgi:hypothetical protein